MNTVFFENSEEARAWDMYVAAFIVYEGLGEGSPEYMADAMILERRKRMAPEKVEREDDLDADGLATLDAAIKAALVAHKMAPEACNDQMRAFARALIAKLLEGMEMAELSHWHAGYHAALTEIRRRAGLEVES